MLPSVMRRMVVFTSIVLTLSASVFFVAPTAHAHGAGTTRHADAAPIRAIVKSLTQFDGEDIRRVEIDFAGNVDARCGVDVVTVRSVTDITPKRSPHRWAQLTPSATAALDGGVEPSTLLPADPGMSVDRNEWFDEVGAIRRGPAAPITTRRVRLVAFTMPDGATYAHSFDDPRIVRLHSGHHDPDLDERGDPMTFVQKALRNTRNAFVSTSSASPSTVGAKGSANETHHEWHSAAESVWVPRAASKLRVFCSNATQADNTLHIHPDAHEDPSAILRRQFGALSSGADDDGIEVRTLYQAGPPSRTFNIIFNAGGYTEEDRQMFFDNASNVSAIMSDSSLDLSLGSSESGAIASMHRTVPFDRYWLSWNIYAVFQPSPQRGASRPLHGISVQNNLNCIHPQDIERAVQCDVALSVALASASPADVVGDPDRCVIVNLVNTHIYGGSASGAALGKYHMGNFFNGFDLNDGDKRARMLSLTNHELGHAFGELMDEYSLGIPEPSNRPFLNCEFGGTPAGQLKWKNWIDLKNSVGEAAFRATYGANIGGWSILDVPEAVCGYTNYRKANANCMMHRLRDFYMCPVCRQAATQTVLGVRFDLEWPRKPVRDVVTVIAPSSAYNSSAPTTVPGDKILTVGGELVLHLAAHLTRGFTVTAQDFDGTPLEVMRTTECYNCIMLNSTHFARYPRDQIVSLRIDIVDDTDHFVIEPTLSSLRSQTHQNTTFRLYVASDIDVLGQQKNLTLETGSRDAVVGRHLSDLQSTYSFCEGEDGNTNRSELVCNMSFPSRTYERPLDVGALLADYEQWVLIGLAGLAVVFLLLWAYAATACHDNANQQARTVFKTQYSCVITLIRRIMMTSAALFLFSSIAAIGIAAYYYLNVNTLGQILLAVGVGLAVVLYLMAFFGFWAVVSRSKRMLVINGIILILASGAILFIFIIVVEVGKELQVESAFQVDMGDVSAQGALGGGGGGSNTTTAPGAVRSAEDESGYWTNQLFDFWTDLVADDPETACAVQGMLECSGFYQNCASDFASTLTCPANCEETNKRYQLPCLSLIKDYIINNYVYIAAVAGTSAGLLVGGVLLNFLLLILLCCQKKEVQKGHSKRIESGRKRGPVRGGAGAGGKAAAAGAGAAGGATAAAAAAGGPAGLQKEEDDQYRALYLLKGLDSSTTQSLVREFKRIDLDGNGELDRKELFVFFKKVLMYKPSAAELDAIFKLADLDGGGTIDVEEFLCLFGCKDRAEAKALLAQIHNPRRQRRVPLPSMKLPTIRRKKAGGGGSPRNAAGEQPLLATVPQRGETGGALPQQEAPAHAAVDVDPWAAQPSAKKAEEDNLDDYDDLL